MEIRLKHLTSISNPYAIGDGDHGKIKPDQYLANGVPYIRVQNLSFSNKINFEGMVYISNEVNLQNSKSILYPGDILVAKTGSIGKAGVLPESIPVANTTSSVGKITIDTKRALPKYIYYCIASDPLQKKMQEISFTKSAQPGFNIEDIKEFRVWLPDIIIQQKIVSFLDKKINAVEDLIKKEKNNISYLILYRKKVITETVLNGLNKKSKKPIVSRWLTNIPDSWSFKKIKYVLDISNGIKVGPFGSTLTGKVLYDKTDIKIYGQWNVIAKSFDIDRNFISKTSFPGLKQYEVIPGDILISMMGTIGKCLTVPSNIKKGIMDSHIIKIRLNKNIYDSNFFEYVYDKDNSFFVWEQLEYLKKGSIMDGLNSTILKEIFLPVPPIKEQKEIVQYLDKFSNNINELIERKSKKIDKLLEYKKSLIYECVTGRRPF